MIAMKALFYPQHNKLEISHQPIPKWEDSEVLIKVAACGICGSELETFRTQSPRRNPPLIMGHEFCGQIVEVGRSVSGWKPGMMVVSNAVISCGKCKPCAAGKTNLCQARQVFGMDRNGAFAEYVNVPAACLIPLPEGVSERQACLTEPLANGVHLVKLSQHLPATRILIIGAGPLGLMALHAFRVLRNAEIFVADIRDERLMVAKRLGAAGVINPSNHDLAEMLHEQTGHQPIDLVIDAVGSSETNINGLNVVKTGGALVVIGLYQNAKSLWSYDIVLGEKQVIGSYAATQEDLQDALNLIASGKIDMTSWVNYYDLDNGVAAFTNMMEPNGSHIKSVLINP